MTTSEVQPAASEGVYGRRLGDCFGLTCAPDFIRVEKTAIAITQIRCDWENNGFTAPIPADEAFLVTMQLRDCAHHDLWIEGKARRTGPLRRGDVSIYDLRTSPVINSTSAFRNIHMYLPRATFHAIARQENVAAVDEISHEPGVGLSDPVIEGLAFALESVFIRSGEATHIFVDHVTTAITARIARIFGSTGCRNDRFHAVLSRRQESVAKDLLASHLDGDIGTAELAAACGMPVPMFRRGFRRATGMTPHEWLMQQQLDRATDLLHETSASLADIARLSGFVDSRQMHRVFVVFRGVAPEQIRSA
jgi:AraC-like DNA-binding protein